MGDHAIAIFAHTCPLPSAKLIDIFIELVGEFLNPHSEFLTNDGFQILLKRILRSNLLVAGRFINKGNYAYVCQSTHDYFCAFCTRLLRFRKQGELPSFQPDLACCRQHGCLETG